jgi:hypothetical protein
MEEIMKKLMVVLVMLSLALPMMAADVRLRVAPGSDGYVDDTTVDVSVIPIDGKIIVEVIIENLDFTLAGFEFELLAPVFLQGVDFTTIGGAGAPYTTTLVGQKLPADIAGDDTGDTFNVATGSYRVGWVATAPGDRPSSGDIVLATFCWTLGRDTAGASCVSALEEIRLNSCTTGAASCPIFANDSAASVSVAFTNSVISVTDPSVAGGAIKGDVNSSGALTTADISPLIQCVFFGQGSAGCPLSATGAAEYLVRVDCNCSGAGTTADISPCINRALGIIPRPSVKRAIYTDLASNGTLTVYGDNTYSAVSSAAFKVAGNVTFGDIVLDDKAIDEGWGVAAKYFPQQGIYHYILYNVSGRDAQIPMVRIPYETASENAKVSLFNSEHFASDNAKLNFVPRYESLTLGK